MAISLKERVLLYDFDNLLKLADMFGEVRIATYADFPIVFSDYFQ